MPGRRVTVAGFLLASILSLAGQPLAALSYGHDFFAESELTAAGAGINVRNCYPNNFLKLCLGSGLSVGQTVYIRNFPSNTDGARSAFYEALGMNGFISRDFWRLRIDFGMRLGLNYQILFNRPDEQFFYGMQTRIHWAVIRQKIYLGMMMLYGATQDTSSRPFSAYGGEDAQSTFAIIPVSFIYVF
ncbi:MAG: hypothetical protein OHK0011_17690 [Turneriella sp.]